MASALGIRHLVGCREQGGAERLGCVGERGVYGHALVGLWAASGHRGGYGYGFMFELLVLVF